MLLPPRRPSPSSPPPVRPPGEFKALADYIIYYYRNRVEPFSRDVFFLLFICDAHSSAAACLSVALTRLIDSVRYFEKISRPILLSTLSGSRRIFRSNADYIRVDDDCKWLNRFAAADVAHPIFRANFFCLLIYGISFLI